MKKHVVVLGGGFGGLTLCQRLRHADVRITLVDRQNHHLFQPLLYQVATAGLSAPDIAEPIRAILSKRADVQIQLDTVRAIDLSRKRVHLRQSTLHYDFLVMALGGQTSYFGHPEWGAHAPGLKSLDDALSIRRGVLLAFERAETESDAAVRRRLMTVAVVGGGPTGVELAGAFAELSRHVLRRDFHHIDPTQAHVVLLEGGSRILSHLPDSLSRKAHRQLEKLGVDIRIGSPVREIRSQSIQLQGGEHLEAANIVWAAGVRAHALTETLGVPLDPSGRIKVEQDLRLPGHETAFAIGDMAHVAQPDGSSVPGVSPAAMQMADYVARTIRHQVEHETRPAPAQRAFRYRDKGTMATIGRSAAVAKIGPLEFSGFPAWLAWLLIHLVFLIGFENRLVVLIQWTYSYFTYRKGARIITGLSGESPPPSSTATEPAEALKTVP